jgi:phage baseplate assembly protein V
MDIEYRLNQLERKLNNMIRIGEVSSINKENCTVKVVFKEFDNSLVSYDLPILVKQAMNTKDYHMLDINEQVVCIFLPTGLEAGFVLGSSYNEEDKPIIANQDIRNLTFSDGASFSYDRKKHELNINITNDNGRLKINANNIDIKAETANLVTTKANVNAKEVEVKADKATIKADSNIIGDLNITGNVKADGNINGTNITASNNISDSTSSMAKMRIAYNGHSHANQGASPPSTPI